MKNYLSILLLFCFQISFSQTSNVISKNEFDNIEINGVKFSALQNSYGDANAIKSLLGNPTSQKLDVDGNQFSFNGLNIGFSALLSSNHDKPIIGGIQITNNNINIKIKNTLVTIGDNISKLGNVKFNTMNNGNKSILYSFCDGCNNFFSIRFNQTTRIITEIIYIEMT